MMRWCVVTATTLVTFAALLTVSCGGGTPRTAITPNTAISKTVRAINSSTVSPTSNPLVAQYSVTANQGGTVEIQFGPDTQYQFHTSPQTIPQGGGQVQILVAGMRPSSTYHMRAVFKDSADDQDVDSDQTFVTGSVPPQRIPTTTVTQPAGATPNSGVELLDLTPGQNNQFEAAAVDMQGNLIWYYDFDNTGGSIPYPIKPLPNGHMLINISRGNLTVLREIDLAGNVVWEISPNDLNNQLAAAGFHYTIEEIHHDVAVLPNGHWILLVRSVGSFMDLPGLPGQTDVTADGLIDLDTNRKPVWLWSVYDHMLPNGPMDINRHPFGLTDWTHGNTVIYSPDDGNLLLSMRHQSWILKIDYRDGHGSGDILWRLGEGGDINLAGGQAIDWFYAQHYPTFIGLNTANNFKLAMYDNGNLRIVDARGALCGSPGAIPCYSRALILSVEEATKTALIDWEDKQPFFSPWGGNIQQFENGNVEFDSTQVSGTPPAARVVEVTQAAPRQTVWQLDIAGQWAYRAFRIPSLYPGVQW